MSLQPSRQPTTGRFGILKLEDMCAKHTVDHAKRLATKGPMLAIVVGGRVCDLPLKERTYYVHQSMLTSRSIFFKRVTNDKRHNPHERVVYLPEDYPNIFELYLSLLYTGKLAIENYVENGETVNQYTLLAQVYVLAEKLQDREVKNFVSEAILLKSRELQSSLCTPVQAVQIIYDGTPEHSQARRLFVDIFADEGVEDWLTAHTNLPREFLYDFSIRMFNKRVPRATESTSICSISAYHELENEDKEEKDGMSMQVRPTKYIFG